MKKAFALILLVSLLAVLFSGCAEQGELSIHFGDSAKIELSKQYDGLTWQSSDTEVATVNNGNVTGVGPGQATITAIYNEKNVAQYTVTVEIVEITDVFLQSNELTLEIGEKAALSYSLFPTNASAYRLSYTSINPEIATVDQGGNVKAVAAGKTNIVLSTASGITASCEITVVEPSAIKQLNKEEAKLFEYMVETFLSSFYNASAARFRNLYTIEATREGYVYSASSFLLADIQGTNKLGGTIHRYYMMAAPSEDSDGYYLVCKDSFYPDDTYIEFPRDVIDYMKINAALDEYWSNSSVSK